jgi:hypothetical protein
MTAVILLKSGAILKIGDAGTGTFNIISKIKHYARKEINNKRKANR